MRNLLYVVLIFFSTLTFAQTANPSYQTESLQNSRFEMIQSANGAKYTFRLDKFTGRVWQYVKGEGDDNGWQEMVVTPKALTSTKPKFQIFVSGLGARFSFLLDNDNGNTWQLVNVKTKDGTDVSVWQKISEY